MMQECTTSTLPAIGAPLTAVAPTAAKAISAVRTFNRARRGVRRFRRAVTIVTCLTVGAGAAAAGAKYLPPLFRAHAAPPARAALLVSGAYGDYGVANPSAVGPAHMQLVTGQVGGQGGMAVIAAPGPLSVTEPSTLGLMLSGILGLFGFRRRKPTPMPEVTEARRQLAEENDTWDEEVKVVGADKMPANAQAHADRVASLRKVIDRSEEKDLTPLPSLRTDQIW